MSIKKSFSCSASVARLAGKLRNDNKAVNIEKFYFKKNLIREEVLLIQKLD
jgi:hypothetical protein